MVGRPDHRGDRAACFEAHLGPALVDVVLGPLLPEFRDLHNWISSLLSRCVSPTLVFLYTFMHNIWRQTHIQKK